MEDGIRRSGLLTASKVLGIIQAVSFGLCLPFMLFFVVVIGVFDVGFMTMLGIVVYIAVMFVLSIIGTVYVHKAQRYWCREYGTIAGGIFIVSSVLTWSLFSILCACFCMSERNKLYQAGNIPVKRHIITWCIIGGISFIYCIFSFVFGMMSVIEAMGSYPQQLPTEYIEEHEDDVMSLNEDNEKVDSANILTEYVDALKRADLYAHDMHFSERYIYDRLTDDNGDNFSDKAAEYAIDNIVVDYKENALHKAQTYYDMGFSVEEIAEALTSEYGEMFTQEEAEYAMLNLDK